MKNEKSKDDKFNYLKKRKLTSALDSEAIDGTVMKLNIHESSNLKVGCVSSTDVW